MTERREALPVHKECVLLTLECVLCMTERREALPVHKECVLLLLECVLFCMTERREALPLHLERVYLPGAQAARSFQPWSQGGGDEHLFCYFRISSLVSECLLLL